ncbi:MAG: polysaccharide pyruvyl transferase family protein [Demequinaceae bacterium]|nr:polysaccharide pyruvyl transferase family protein [Demequinaceae bacterium]
MKVAIIGSSLSGNKGAAAMLESAVVHLTERVPGIEITHLSMYPGSDAALNPYPHVRVLDASPLRLGIGINGGALCWKILPFLRPLIRRTTPEVAAIAEADVLIDQGGITFVDGRGKYLIYNIASLLPAVFVKTPVVKCAQALGPFKNRVNRFWAKRLLPRMAAIVSRGAVTHDHLLGLGLKNVVAGADLAFTLEVRKPDVEAAKAAVDLRFFSGKDVVGISPSQVLRGSVDSGGRDYVSDVVAQIDFITESMGRPVLLIPHSARTKSGKLHNNDLPVCRDIYARVTCPDKVLFPDKELSSQVLRHLIGQCDLFVASRFHAMVSSLSMGVPTFVIGWSHKYREVLDMFELADWAVASDDVDLEAFRTSLARLDREKAAIRKQIQARLPEVRAQALNQLDLIERIAGGN